MFKKTLLALAITGFAGSAVAASSVVDANGSGVTATDRIQTISYEGAVNDTTVTPVAIDLDIDATQLANYKNVQKIVVEITGGTLSAGTSATLALTNAGADGLASNVVSYPTLTRVEFAISGDNADSNADGLTLTGPAFFTIAGISVVADDFNMGSQIKYTVTAESAVAGAAIESVTQTVTQVVGQFSAAVATADKLGQVKVDVEDDRETFVGGGLTDTATVTITDAGSDLLTAVPVNATQDYTLKGDFTFLDTDGDGTQDGTLSGTNAADLQSTVFTNVAGALSPQLFTIGNPADNVLQTQSFTADASFDYNPATAGSSVVKFTATDLDAGTWVLNGAEDEVAFLPFGSDYAQSITVTNTGSKSGEITVELTYQGEVFTKVLTAEASANSVTNISLEVAAFAAESGITDNAAIKVVVNAPDNNNQIKVKALYFHKPTADRVLTY